MDKFFSFFVFLTGCFSFSSTLFSASAPFLSLSEKMPVYAFISQAAYLKAVPSYCTRFNVSVSERALVQTFAVHNAGIFVYLQKLQEHSLLRTDQLSSEIEQFYGRSLKEQVDDMFQTRAQKAGGGKTYCLKLNRDLADDPKLALFSFEKLDPDNARFLRELMRQKPM